MTDWKDTQPTGLEEAINRFKRELPGWWFSVGECQVSCDASCGPTRETPDIGLIPHDDRFNSGFHVDMEQPSTLAQALDVVRMDALKAKAAIAHRDPHHDQ